MVCYHLSGLLEKLRAAELRAPLNCARRAS
jgi:hypothetical protein